MLEKQARILSKKSSDVAGPTSLSGARVDREANALLSLHVRQLIDEGRRSEVIELLQQSTSVSMTPIIATIRHYILRDCSNELDEFMRMILSKNIVPPRAAFDEVVRYYARGGRTLASSGTGSSKSVRSTRNSSSPTNTKKTETEAARASFYFADMKRSYLPSSSTYAEIWDMVPFMSKVEGRYTVLGDYHDALWREMTETGVAPNERVYEAVIRSVRPDIAAATASAKLNELEGVFRAAYGTDPQAPAGASTVASSNDIDGRGRKLSRRVAKLWLEAALQFEGEEAAFRLASAVLCKVSENGAVTRADASAFHSSNALLAIGRVYEPEMATKLGRRAHAARVIPATFCPLELLIEVLFQKGLTHSVVNAWNQMNPASKISAGPSTITAVSMSANLDSLTELFQSLPNATKTNPELLEALLTIASGGKGPKDLLNALREFLHKEPLPDNLKEINFREKAAPYFEKLNTTL